MSVKDAAREERIFMEAVADANGPEEQAMGWYYYLDDKISFPFAAECIAVNKRNPLELGERITVVHMAGEDDCEHDIYVEISWKGKMLAVPLSQIKPLSADKDTVEVIGDWHYWKNRGYTF
ncbi:MAG: calcium-binding protein [Deltaproteobacteria bacterium]|jgi:hypothetical protein|nr:calcium-binding protein [Deltaproteobacteria bacterium]